MKFEIRGTTLATNSPRNISNMEEGMLNPIISWVDDVCFMELRTNVYVNSKNRLRIETAMTTINCLAECLPNEVRQPENRR